MRGQRCALMEKHRSQAQARMGSRFAAEADAEAARARALDPLLSSDGAAFARREMDDASFKRDRLREAARKLSERVETVRALEAEHHARAEHERVLAERNLLAEEMERMSEPIAQIARLVSEIDQFDGEIGRLNATSTARLRYIRPFLSGASRVVEALFQDGVVWDAFIAVAGRARVAKGKATAASAAQVTGNKVVQTLGLPSPNGFKPGVLYLWIVTVMSRYKRERVRIGAATVVLVVYASLCVLLIFGMVEAARWVIIEATAEHPSQR